MMKTNNYRKTWESTFGPIPKDEDGRSYDNHHVDGDRTNNHIDNLRCLSIREHYDLHFSQKDYGACLLLSRKIKMSPDELSRLSKIVQNERIKNGTHNFLNSDWQSKNQKKIVQRGVHHFLSGEIQRKSSLSRSKKGQLPAQLSSVAGTHQWAGGEIGRKVQRKRVESNTHNWLGGDSQRASQQKRVKAGIHQWLSNSPTNPNKVKVSCLFCKKETTLPGLSSNHKHDGNKRKRKCKE